VVAAPVVDVFDVVVMDVVVLDEDEVDDEVVVVARGFEEPPHAPTAIPRTPTTAAHRSAPTATIVGAFKVRALGADTSVPGEGRGNHDLSGLPRWRPGGNSRAARRDKHHDAIVLWLRLAALVPQRRGRRAPQRSGDGPAARFGRLGG
jgi:hypothetical protein